MYNSNINIIYTYIQFIVYSYEAGYILNIMC